MMRMAVFPNVIWVVIVLGVSDYVHGQNQCDAIMDLSLIIDSSGSITFNDFQRGKGALIDLVSRLNIDVEKVGVAIINYASTVMFTAEPNAYQFHKIAIIQHIAALPRLGTNTATGDALNVAKSYCESNCRQLNEGIPRIFVVFTDGRSNEGQSAIVAARAIRNTPIGGTIFAIGIGKLGKTGQEELLEIAGDRDYVLNINSYLDLARVVNAITMKMCEFPAFILPDIKTHIEVKGNHTRYYKIHTLHKFGKNALFQIEVNNTIGQPIVFTSITDKKPMMNVLKSVSTRTTGGTIYTTYVPANAENFYFSVKGINSNINKFDFVVHVQPVNFWDE